MTQSSRMNDMFVRHANLEDEGEKSVTLDWGGEKRTFLLGKDALDELQQRLQIGPALLLAKLRGGHWTTKEVTETIALSLIGAGMHWRDASDLIVAQCDRKPIANSAATAALIVGAALFGMKVEDGTGG